MNSPTATLLVFTDLDGCLLNKTDYDYSPALPMLKRFREAQVPVILCSSKTQAEMRSLAVELELAPAPMTCENGGVMVWPGDRTGTLLGRERGEILELLQTLKRNFLFRSFADLGVDGVMQTTDLPREKAEAAISRQCTEPLLWDEPRERIPEFRAWIESAGLTLTEGGRFWHVAAPVSKGSAMRAVVERYVSGDQAPTTVAVGDSPIDQSMLDVATIPVGIPQPDGRFKVSVNEETGILAKSPGSAGWAQAMGIVADRFGIPA